MKMRVTSIDVTKPGGPGEQDVVVVKFNMAGADPKTTTTLSVRTSNVPLLRRIAHWGSVFEVTFEPAPSAQADEEVDDGNA